MKEENLFDTGYKTTIKIGKDSITQEHSAKLLGMTMDDNQAWKSHIHGKGGLIPSLNKRLYTLKRLRNHLNDACLKKVADSIFTSKLRYGLQLCSKVRWTSEEKKEGLMKDLQKIQNKLVRFLNKSTIKDKVNTGFMLNKFKMASINQLNAQIKLTEMWKTLNLDSHKNKTISDLKVEFRSGDRERRSAFKGNLLETGASHKALKTFINDSTRVWNRAPQKIKMCKSLYSAKKEIKIFIKSLPI